MYLPVGVKDELRILQSMIPGKEIIDLDDYAKLYGVRRQHASVHLRRKGIPFTKDGNRITLALLDIAIHKLNCKTKGPVIKTHENVESLQEAMSNRRGFSRKANERRFGKGGS